METLEIEFKNLLTQAEFQVLYNTYQLDTQPSWEQTNVYYDTPQHHLAEKKRHYAYDYCLTMPKSL